MKCAPPKDKFCTLQHLTGAADAHGSVDELTDSNWSAYVTGYASVISQGGREFWKVHQVSADVSHEWTLDWNATLEDATPAMRLVSEDTTHQILSVVDVDLAHREIKIQTRREV